MGMKQLQLSFNALPFAAILASKWLANLPDIVPILAADSPKGPP